MYATYCELKTIYDFLCHPIYDYTRHIGSKMFTFIHKMKGVLTCQIKFLLWITEVYKLLTKRDPYKVTS